MKIPKFLKGLKVYLRPYIESDLDLVIFGKNDPHVRETLHLFSPMTHEQVALEMKSWCNTKETTLFTICDHDTDEPVGQTAFVRIDLVSRAAVFYIAIYDPQFWGKGYAKEATNLMLQYAFDILNLNRVQLHVSTENIPAIKIYKDAGYSIEGTLREAMYHNNKYVDFYVMGILRSDYYKNQR